MEREKEKNQGRRERCGDRLTGKGHSTRLQRLSLRTGALELMQEMRSKHLAPWYPKGAQSYGCCVEGFLTWAVPPQQVALPD